MMSSPQSENQSTRIGSLDFIRGVAVLGIFVINIESFAFPAPFSPWQSGFESELDRHFRFWTYLFFQGKFFSLFALMFGVGFYLFLEKAQRYGQATIDLYAHRMFWLFVIGAAHAYLIWPGDILYHYAICGLLLLPARTISRRTLIWVIIALLALISGHTMLATERLQDRQANYAAAISTAVDDRSQEQLQVIERWERRYSQKEALPLDPDSLRLGNVLDHLTANADRVGILDGHVAYWGILFRTLLMMLVGVLLYRLGVFSGPTKLTGYWPITLGMLALGLAANYYRHWSWTYVYFEPVTHHAVALVYSFSPQWLGLAYLLLLNGLYHRVLNNWRANPIERVGRLALSNYLFQSLLAAFLFYGIGLGLHGSLTRSELWPLIVGVWSVQISASLLWLRFYRQGPMEMTWRRLMMYSARTGEAKP